VRTREGNTTRVRVNVQRGELALMTMHSTTRASARDVLKWVTLVGAVLTAGVGGVAQVFAVSDAQQLTALGRPDPVTHLPSTRYADVINIEEERARFQTIAIGCFIGAGVLGVTSVLLWGIGNPPRERATARRTEPLSVAITTNGVAVGGYF
jgi:hypothetical protein